MRVRLEPPLLPTPDQGRGLLRRELLDPAYQQQNPVERLLAWLERVLTDGLDAASRAPAVSTVVAMVLLLLLVAALGLLASRARSTARAPGPAGDVLGDAGLDAAGLRARAEAALGRGDHDEAVLDGFRALARRQVERGRLGEDPGATAREVAVRLAAGTDLDARLLAAATAFDAIRYGGLPASRGTAVEVLDLDAAVDRSRPVAATAAAGGTDPR